MSGNSIGKIFKISTFGESHGSAIGVVIDGVVPGMKLSQSDVQVELDRRRPGQNSLTTQRTEADTVEILSGVFEGKTTGAPLALLVRNSDARSQDYEAIKNIFRPGHADYSYMAKYGIRDHRGGGRASGRETIGRVAAGALAKKMLKNRNITITGYTRAVADVCAQDTDLSVIESNPVRCPDAQAANAMIKKIKEAQANGDSVGGIVEAVVQGCPAGLGDPVFDKLNARLAHAVMSIGAVAGIEFGDGFAISTLTGSQANDEFIVKDGVVATRTNHSGGILGGISTGNDIVLRVAVKPTSSVARPQQTVTTDKKPVAIEIAGRHDPCICSRVVPVVEAMIAVTLLDCLLIQDAITASKPS